LRPTIAWPLRAFLLLALTIAPAIPALATSKLGVIPSAVSVFPTQSSPNISVTISYSPASNAGSSTLQLTGLPAGVTAEPALSYSFAKNSVSSQVVFHFVTDVQAPSGSYSITIHDPPNASKDSGGSAVIVLGIKTPTFHAAVNPSAIALVAFGAAQGAVVTTTTDPGYTAPIAYTFSGLPSFISFGGSQTASPPYGPLTFSFSAGVGAVTGTYTGFLTATSGAITKTLPFSVQVTSPPAPVLTSLTPATIVQGSSESVILTGANFLAGATVVISGGDVAASAVVVASSTQISLTASAAGSAPPGPRTVTVKNPDGQTSNTVSLAVILPPPASPEVVSVFPSHVAAGTRGISLVVRGSHFAFGAAVTASLPVVSIEKTVFVSATELHAVVSVSGDAPSGVVGVGVRNPDGASSPTAAALLVSSANSIGAPAGVTTAAVVFPVDGAAMGQGETVYPRGLLATSGTGIIQGTWQFDGVPFDRFVATATAGEPLEVLSRVPIPFSFAGEHRLRIAIESPQVLVSAPVSLIQEPDRASALRLLEPADGSVFGRSRPPFRWSLVPGASGYEVEIETEKDGAARHWRVSDSTWQLDSAHVADIGPGIHRWRVRAVFPVEVAGEPTAWRRFAVIPEHVRVGAPSLERDGVSGRLVVRWSGGTPGLVYFLEFLDPAGTVVFSALTARPEYLVPEEPARAATALRLRVTAFGPDRQIVGRGESTPGSPRGNLRRIRPDGFSLAAKPPALSRMDPPQGSELGTTTPRVTATWSASVSAGDIVLLVDGTDVVALCAVTPVSIAYDPFFPLEPGPHTVSLSLSGAATTWTFRVKPGATAQRAAVPAVPGTAALPVSRNPWGLTVTGLGTVLSGDRPDQSDAARLLISGQGDLHTEALSAKYSGDVSFRHDVQSPHSTVQESRNWIAAGGAGTENVRAEVRAGYAAPSFLDQATILTAGLARSGVEGKLQTPLGTASVYESFGAASSGVISGTTGPSQKIEAAAIQTPKSSIFDIRAIALEARDSRGDLTVGGRGTLLGLFARITLGPGLVLTAEGAHSRVRPRDDATDHSGAESDGNAWRFRANGVVLSTFYDLNVHSSSADFRNPSNLGLTSAGISNRAGGDLLLARSVGKASLSAQLRYAKGGSAAGGTPDQTEKGGMVSANIPLAKAVAFSMSGSLTKDSSSATGDSPFPKLDRRQTAVTASLVETPGKISFSESYSDQRLRDGAEVSSSSRNRMVALSGTGALLTDLNVSALVSGTRSESGFSVGHTDLLLVSLQPSLAIRPVDVSLSPAISYNRTKDGATGVTTSSEQYRALVIYAPKFARSLLSLQLSGEWNRSRSSGPAGVGIAPASSGFDHRYAAAVTLRWGAGPLGPPPSSPNLPGTTPLVPPQRGGAGKPNSPFGNSNANGTAPAGAGVPWS
jgi:hypothetical protein